MDNSLLKKVYLVIRSASGLLLELIIHEKAVHRSRNAIYDHLLVVLERVVRGFKPLEYLLGAGADVNLPRLTLALHFVGDDHI